MIFSNSQALLQSSFDSAENLIKDRAVSFYDAFSLLPQDLFRAVAVVYAFCRTADDIADQAQPSETEHTLQRLLDLEDMIKTIFSKKDDRLLKLDKIISKLFLVKSIILCKILYNVLPVTH